MNDKPLQLDSPADIRALIRRWIQETCEKGKLPFEGGGVVVQMLQVFLKSYEMEKLEDIEKRLDSLEKSQKKE
jgi:hypothetical protein